MANEPVVTIVGNLTADPELRYISSGQAVANFTVASTPRNLNRQTNQWEDGEAMFIRCSVWREYAENVVNSLSKGMRVVVTGKLSVRSYQANDGSTRTNIELAVDEIGPSLRYATAQVTKVARALSQSQGGYGAQASYNAPQGGGPDDRFATGGAPAGGSAFDDGPVPF